MNINLSVKGHGTPNDYCNYEHAPAHCDHVKPMCRENCQVFCAYLRKIQCPRDVATEISVWSYMVQGFPLFDKCGLDWFLKSFADIFEVFNFSWQPLCIPIEKAKRDFDITSDFGKVRFGLARLGLIQTLPIGSTQLTVNFWNRV